MEPVSLRVLIRQKLADGRLPRNDTPTVSGAPSAGETCDACDRVIAANQFVMHAASTDLTTRAIHLDVECFYFWDAARDAPGALIPSIGSGVVSPSRTRTGSIG